MELKKNQNGCEGCVFFAEFNRAKVCTEERQPRGTEGHIYLHDWDKPNDCELKQEMPE